MPKLKRGAVTVDLVDGSIHGDLDHCPREDLLESAQALLSLLPHVKHKGLWGLAKAYDATCYLYTTAKRYRPPPGLDVETDFPWGQPTVRVTVINNSHRETYWHGDGYSQPVGKLVDGQVAGDTEGVTNHYQPPSPPAKPGEMQRCPNCNLGLVPNGERPWVKTCPQCNFAYVGIPPRSEEPRGKKPTPPSQQLTLPM